MYGSVIFKDFVAERDATVVDRLRKAGAIIVGKTTMGEFASSYVGSAFGVVRNAYDLTRIASGSSGGTGAGVAANFCGGELVRGRPCGLTVAAAARAR
jgi:amidase